MSKYKVGFLVNSKANAFCKNVEVVDLIDNYGYSEEEAKEIIENKDKIFKLLEEWVWETIETNVQHLKTEEEVKNWWSIGN
mgnify:CR=1 FL=1